MFDEQIVPQKIFPKINFDSYVSHFKLINTTTQNFRSIKNSKHYTKKKNHTTQNIIYITSTLF